MVSVTIRVNFSGKPDLAALFTKVDNAIQGAGIDTQAYAKQACPVDTGRLRSSIQYQKTGLAQCTVGTNVFYSWYVELGTYKMAARPFLFPAFQRASTNLIAELKAMTV
jgi:HK97 gp10 family phage protein